MATWIVQDTLWETDQSLGTSPLLLLKVQKKYEKSQLLLGKLTNFRLGRVQE